MWREYSVEGHYDAMWLTRALVYSSQGRRCRAVGCMAIEGVTAWSQTGSLWNQAATHCMKAFRPSVALRTATIRCPHVSWESSFVGDSEIYKINK